MIAVGYRVNSEKATKFRIEATKVLKEYLTTGEVKKREYTKLEIAKMLVESEEERERLLIENNNYSNTIKLISSIQNSYSIRESRYQRRDNSIERAS